MSRRAESKWDSKDDDLDDGKGYEGKDEDDKPSPPKVDVISVDIGPSTNSEVDAPLHLNIRFELDRDCIAAFWVIKFLVDAADKRLIRILGETEVDDYPEGDNAMDFSVARIDISGIPPSTLTNSSLLMACLVVDGEEVASVNMVTNVFEKNGKVMREILNPLA